MNYNEINNRLKQIKIEDYIWIIYIGIIILSYYSNYLEKKYFLFNNINDKEKYIEIIIIIFTILIFIYYYFLKSSFDDMNNLKENDSKEKKKLVYLSFVGSLLIFISGCVFLYIAFEDNNLDVELAFN